MESSSVPPNKKGDVCLAADLFVRPAGERDFYGRAAHNAHNAAVASLADLDAEEKCWPYHLILTLFPF